MSSTDLRSSSVGVASVYATRSRACNSSMGDATYPLGFDFCNDSSAAFSARSDLSASSRRGWRADSALV